jgi:hypothetical protein
LQAKQAEIYSAFEKWLAEDEEKKFHAFFSCCEHSLQGYEQLTGAMVKSSSLLHNVTITT